jgi:HAD superfamily hydrolase (TIGR01490 family)
METMREYMSKLVTGWNVDQVQQIVGETLDEIVDPMVFEEALQLIEEHKAAGNDVIIISSSGTDIVEPIGQRLGVDLAIGTQVAIEEGEYTGEILFYAYGPGKADAMRSLAEERGYDLSECYAYSDSHTDLPMLEAVGHPVVVNPDSELKAIAEERDWPIRNFRQPVALREQATKRSAIAAGAGVALASVALGLTWYARRRGARA